MRWILLLIAGWTTLTAGLFLGSLSGTIAEQQFNVSGNIKLLIQGIVMSGLVVPTILYFYQRVYRLTDTHPKKLVYSWKSAYHFITGVLLAIVLASLGFIIASFQGWIVIEQWHTPNHWFTALMINTIIAFLYEALPEELALRGMVYDVLRHRFVAWLAVLGQTLLFLSVPIVVNQIQATVGLAPGNSINLPYVLVILCFGICLQLLRIWTKSLWATIGFHLTYLEISRFAISQNGYDVPPILTYHDSLLGLGGVFIVGMIIVGGIVVSLFILCLKKFIWRSSNSTQSSSS
ncbi:CPBP family intramembrane glutamic endopeptidase [Priestia aryabhattai]|uniref:CPBP family intramembrane glutamic endopeptidase n=1 Tax=Priestia aryabhattai TaxID=412384 RepID=UPI001CCF7F86|nr:CPBP family intramembrane glutamic endopeptidase [Priestia aryabhattai]MBZ6489449.1 CPBP family intramembrane metalloprotease [Priestia aryabhattai]MDH3111141.1 CPBP family intramembrane metalloprotease [Priestia aryabhattai]MDH3129810.1 CPBP family intramembrane metalloprotease [Priestia aryabhattai]MDH3130287.1 CPBP family intramembrane metalloprotease [Priestia aryabhattai]